MIKSYQNLCYCYIITVTIDGIRIKFDDGWALIRASNTQPALVLRFEAKDEKRLTEIRNFVESKLKKIIEEIGDASKK